MNFRSIKIFTLILMGGISLASNNVYAHNKTHCEYQKYQTKSCKTRPIIGISGDFGYSVDDDGNFKLPFFSKRDFTQTSDSINPGDASNHHFPANIFNAYNDYSYGGNLSYGYLIKNSLEANLELGYHQIKNIDKDSQGSFIKSNIMSAMVNGIFYVNINSFLHPYFSVGAGIARTNATANIVDKVLVDVNVTVPDIISIDNLKILKFAYQAGLGLTTHVGSAILGIGYKLFAVADIKDNENFSDLTILNREHNDIENKDMISTLNPGIPFTFGTLSNKVHNISIFAKKAI